MKDLVDQRNTVKRKKEKRTRQRVYPWLTQSDHRLGVFTGAFTGAFLGLSWSFAGGLLEVLQPQAHPGYKCWLTPRSASVLDLDLNLPGAALTDWCHLCLYLRSIVELERHIQLAGRYSGLPTEVPEKILQALSYYVRDFRHLRSLPRFRVQQFKVVRWGFKVVT